MNGTLALFIALISYGNEYLAKGTSLHHLDFNNTTLIYCNNLAFTDGDGRTPNGTMVAHSPQEWFKFLKENGCKRLKIFFYHSNDQSKIKDFESAGFGGGGGQWIIEAVYDNYANYWTCKENVTDRDRKDKRIWDTRFYTIAKKQPVVAFGLSPEKAKANLSESLKKIMTFAYDTKSNYWAEVFKKARENLDSAHPVVEYYKDCIVADDYSLQSKQLLFSASVASVFGGMGSWNDIVYPPEQEKINTRLSADLYDRINEAIIVAVNKNR